MSIGLSRRALLATPAALLSRKALAAFAPPELAKSPVSLVSGDDRRKNITAALTALDAELLPKLERRKTVVIKPNFVSVTRQLAASHADSIRGILDWLEPRFKGPVVIAESSAGETNVGYETFKFVDLTKEYKRNQVKLVCLNEEGLYETIHLLNGDLHIQPTRLAARLLDPDAFVISAGPMKTHNVVIATLSIKNMTLGAPLKSKKGETPRWNDKRIYHGGVRQTHYDMMLTAQRMKANWGAAVIDGFEGMEGNGPSSGTPVESRLAIASPDFVAADRIGIECMGINPDWMGYIQYCGKTGVGNFERDKIEVRGVTVESVVKKYQLHGDLDRELQWMGPLEELPPKLG
jgi:uncharacterized protein (DUF362 family)